MAHETALDGLAGFIDLLHDPLAVSLLAAAGLAVGALYLLVEAIRGPRSWWLR